MLASSFWWIIFRNKRLHIRLEVYKVDNWSTSIIISSSTSVSSAILYNYPRTKNLKPMAIRHYGSQYHVAESQAMVITSHFFHSHLYTFHVQLDGHTPREDTRMCSRDVHAWSLPCGTCGISLPQRLEWFCSHDRHMHLECTSDHWKDYMRMLMAFHLILPFTFTGWWYVWTIRYLISHLPGVPPSVANVKDSD